MSKKHIISVVSGILLISGGTFLGTKAWLSDSKPIKNDLIITTGSFELEIDHDLPWIITSSDDTEIDNKSNQNEFTNVRPGDTFEKVIKIKNTGSLKQVLSVFDMTEEIDTNIFKIQYEGLDKINNQIIYPDKTKTIKVKVQTKAEIMDKNNHTKKTIDLSKIVPVKNIEANQVNYKEQPK